MPKYLLLSPLALFFISCTSHLNPNTVLPQQNSLYSVLLRTNRSINHAEARTISREAVSYSRNLASKYKVTTPPLVHNFLVNIRAKERGLCYQWSDDLYLHLKKFHFKSVRLKPVGANIGKFWTEHNALVILPKNSNNFEQGVLLDPWRNSGKLYFTPILNDPEYKWIVRTDRGEVY